MTTSERPDQEPETPSQQPASQPIAGTGRLAQVIATRGGLAPPEAPFVIEHREALIYMLCEAAELEHGIMCQYLFAAFSLKQDDGEGLTEAELAATRRWRKVISHVATQEMLHLALVQNLLTAIGAAPHLSRPNFPHPASHYPAGVHLALLPFGEEAVRHFMFLERPEGMDIRDADGMAAFGRAQPLMEAGDIVPRGQDFKTVGHMYRSIEAGFRHLAAKHGEDWLFVGPPRAQATPEYFGWPELVPVTDLASAQRAIDEILEQGEGPRGPGRRHISASSSRFWTSTSRPRRPIWAWRPPARCRRSTSARVTGTSRSRCAATIGHGAGSWTCSTWPTRSCCRSSSASSRTRRRPTPSSRRSRTRPWA